MDECTLWQRIRQQIHKSCSNLDQLWIKRRRIFTTELVLKGLLQLCVSRSQQSYLRILSEIVGDSEVCPAASSFCDARSKVDSFLLSEVRRDVLEVWDELHSKPPQSWHGYELYAVDGSKINLPLNLLALGYRPSGSGRYPLGLVSVLLRVRDRMICDIRLSKVMDERDEAHEHLTHLGKKDLVIYDRGFLSFGLLTAHIYQDTHAVFRVTKEASYVVFKDFWNSRKLEDIVTIDPSQSAYYKASKRYSEYEFKPITVRLIKYKIGTETYVLATTLLDPKIKRQDLMDLYSLRWTCEETYKILKPVLDLEAFHSTKENGVKQEIEATALLWNISRMLGSFCETAIKKTRSLLNVIALPA